MREIADDRSEPAGTDQPAGPAQPADLARRMEQNLAEHSSHLHRGTPGMRVAACVAEDPGAFEPLLWGQRVRGLRVRLPAAPQDRVAELLAESWRRKAPRSLVAELDARKRVS